MGIENLLDTIKELLSEVRAGYCGDELFLVVGRNELRQLQILSKSYIWRFTNYKPRGERKGKFLKATVFGMPLIYIPSYDGVKIKPKSKMTDVELSSQMVWDVDQLRKQ